MKQYLLRRYTNRRSFPCALFHLRFDRRHSNVLLGGIPWSIHVRRRYRCLEDLSPTPRSVPRVYFRRTTYNPLTIIARRKSNTNSICRSVYIEYNNNSKLLYNIRLPMYNVHCTIFTTSKLGYYRLISILISHFETYNTFSIFVNFLLRKHCYI